MPYALIVTTVASTLGFCMNDIAILEKNHEIHIATNFGVENPASAEKTKELKAKLKAKKIVIHEMEYSRNPFNKNNIAAYRRTRDLIKKNQYDIIHCHTPVAAAITRLAARKARKNGTKVIYTAHGFHFYKGAPLMNWCVYYPVERFLARYTDVLITINHEDYQGAKNSFKAKKIAYLPGVGIDISKFSRNDIDIEQKRKDLGIPKNSFLMISVGEINENKNHETVIKALAELKNKDIYYVVCGRGALDSYLLGLAKELGLEMQVKILGHREDVSEIYQASDLFVFPSYREGLSVSLMEAMASGLPVVCSDIRGNNDLIDEDAGGYLVKPSDVDGFRVAIKKLFENPDLRKKFSISNQEKVVQFSIRNVDRIMRQIYNEGDDIL